MNDPPHVYTHRMFSMYTVCVSNFHPQLTIGEQASRNEVTTPTSAPALQVGRMQPAGMRGAVHPRSSSATDGDVLHGMQVGEHLR